MRWKHHLKLKFCLKLYLYILLECKKTQTPPLGIPKYLQGHSWLFEVCLGFAYFAETENFLLKECQIKVKISWNSTVRPINNTKKYSEAYE